MIDTFATMLHQQSDFQQGELDRLFPKGDWDKTQLHHALCSHMIAEAQELMDTQPWYLHKKPQASTRYATVTEMVDCFKWLLNLLVLHGVSAAEFQTTFEEKSFVVKDRIRTEVFVHSNPGPCLILDLDGVLCDRDSRLVDFYDKNWRRYDEGVREWHLKTFGKESVSTMYDLRQVLSAAAYERLKFDFYESGEFFNCLPFSDVLDTAKYAAGEGVPVVLLSSRSVRKHPRLHFLTIGWLESHQVEYDALIFADDKDKALVGWADRRCVLWDDDDRFIETVKRICCSCKVQQGPWLRDQLRTSVDDLKGHRAKEHQRAEADQSIRE